MYRGNTKYAAIQLTNDVYHYQDFQVNLQNAHCPRNGIYAPFSGCKNLEDSEWIVAALPFTLERLPDDVEIYIHIMVKYYDSAN